MDEIKNTDVDREALRVLLSRYKDTSGIDTSAASASLLNETWSRMAQSLAATNEIAFTALTDWIKAQIEGMEEGLEEASVQGRRWPERELRLAGLRRAEDLLGLIIEWRGETWAAAEVAAGRDPYVGSEPRRDWTPPAGWVGPAKT
jgi:hypothetical protein